jgi:hypothetical protein
MTERLSDLQLHGGTCPTCGQQVPPLTNRFATGSRGVLPKVTTHEPGSPLHPEGELAINVLDRLRGRQPVADICAALDVTESQVRGVAEHYRDRLADLMPLTPPSAA